MQWVILFLISAATMTLACFAAALLARLVSLIPWAWARRWLVILCALVIVAIVALLAVIATYFPDEYRDLWRVVVDDYRTLPSFTLLLYVPLAAAAAACLLALGSAFWPEPLVPYEPRGAYWSLRGIVSWFGLMAGLAVAALVAQEYRLRQALREVHAQAQAVAAELAPAAAPADDNAAVHYQRVVDMMAEIDKIRSDDAFADLPERLAKCDLDRATAEQYFAHLAPMYDELRRAADKPRCRFDDKYVPLHVFDALRAQYKLFSAMSYLRQLSNWHACAGRPDEAIACLEQMRRFVDHLNDDPRAREPEFYYWCESWIRQGLEHLSAHGGDLPEEPLRRLIAAEPLPAESIYRQGIRWHAAAIQQHLVNVYTGAEVVREGFGFDGALGGAEQKLPRWMFLAGMRALTLRDELAALRAAFPFLDRPDDDDAWEPRWDDAAPEGRLVATAKSISYLPYWLERANANRHMSNIAIAVTLYRQQEGDWPESLDELSPEHLAEMPPVYGGEPLRVRSIEDGLMVYSADLDEAFAKFDDSKSWWRKASEFVHDGHCLLLGRARERLIEITRF